MDTPSQRERCQKAFHAIAEVIEEHLPELRNALDESQNAGHFPWDGSIPPGLWTPLQKARLLLEQFERVRTRDVARAVALVAVDPAYWDSESPDAPDPFDPTYGDAHDPPR